MKRFLSILLASAAIGLAAAPAEATLYDRGGGLIYDNDLNITWLQDANYANTTGYDDALYGYDTNGRMTWGDAVNWAANLSYYDSVRNVTYDDWRLPIVVPQNYNFGTDGTTGFGYNITTGSEMGHLYYTELGNLGYYDASGNHQPGFGLANTGAFTNLQPGYYWSGTEYAPNTYAAWYFNFNNGNQNANNKNNNFYALAARPGE